MWDKSAMARRRQLLDPNAQQLKVRLPAALRSKIEKDAREAKTTLSDTIVDHLEDFYEWREQTNIPLGEELLSKLYAAATANRREFEVEAAERLRQSFELLWFVPSDRIRAELEIASELNERSINEELEHRVEHSFKLELQFYREPGAAALRRAINILIDLITDLEIITGRRVFGPEADPWAHRQACELIKTWLVINRPQGETEPPTVSNKTWHGYLKPMPKKFIEHFGALMTLKEQARPGSFKNIEYRYLLDLFDPVPVDRRLSLAPGRGSALRLKGEEEASIAQQYLSKHKLPEDELNHFFAGTYNVQSHFVVWRPSIHRDDGPIPPANAQGISCDWYLVCISSGMGSGNAPSIALRAGDQLIPDPTGSAVWHILPASDAEASTDTTTSTRRRRRRSANG
jgi:hypothetical protein